MKYDTLKALVNAKVYENTEQRITGGDMNNVLQSAIASLGAHYQMGGLVSPNDQITVGDEPVVFLATTTGTYTYFGGLVVADGEVALLVWSGTAWSKQTPDIATRTEVSQLGQKLFDADNVASITKGGIIQAGYTNNIFELNSVIANDSIAKIIVDNANYDRLSFYDANSQNMNKDDFIGVAYGIIPAGTKKNGVRFNVAPAESFTTDLRIYIGSVAILTKYLLENYIPGLNSTVEEKFTAQNTINEEIEDTIATIHYDSKTESSQLDYDGLALQYGAMDNSTGKILSHTLRLVTTNILPIKELSVIHTLCSASDSNNYYRIGVYYYHIDRFNGKETYLQNVWYLTNYGRRNQYRIVPKGANGVRFMFSKYVSGSEAKINSSELAANISIESVFPDIYEDTNTHIIHINKQQDLRINDYSGFILGTNLDINLWDKQSTQIIPLEVVPGEEYAIFCNMKNGMYSFDIKLFADMNLAPISSITLGVQTSTGISGHYYNKFKVPNGIKYIRIAGVGNFNTTTFTPTNAIDADFHIINITKYGLLWAEKVVSLVPSAARYAQGIACQNGYIFQAFSDGTIDIYNSVFELVQGNISVPTPEGVSHHLNSLNFQSGKYADTDSYTILMCQPDINENHYGIRIIENNGVFSFERVCNFPVPALDENTYIGDQMFFDDLNKIAIRICQKKVESDQYTQGYGELELRRYSYTGQLTGTPSFTEESSSVFIYPRIFPTQAGKIVNGKLYVVFGTDNRSAYLIGFDLDKHSIIYVNDLRKDSFGIDLSIEPQGFDFYKDRLCLATTKGIYLLTN